MHYVLKLRFNFVHKDSVFQKGVIKFKIASSSISVFIERNIKVKN